MASDNKIKASNNKRILFKIVFFFVVIIVILLFRINKINKLFLSDKKGEVIFFDVGQGDSIFIKTPKGKSILIDGGPDNSVLSQLGDNYFYFQRQIDWLIISHEHDDHIIGLIEIIKRYKINNIVYLDNNYSSIIFLELLAQAKRKKINIISLQKNAELGFEKDCRLNLFNPLLLNVLADDNNSLIVKFDCRNSKVLFTGDNSAKVEEKLIASNWDLSAGVLKAAHHGSKTANSLEFINKIHPSLFVISVGKENKFGHPSGEVLERIKDLGLDAKRTDQVGNVKIFIDN